MKKIFLLLISLFVVISTFSQSTEWGPKQTAKNGILNPDCLITSNESNYYVLSGLTSKSEVMTFGLDHKMIKSEPITFNSDLKLKNQKLIKTSKGIFLLMFAKIKAEKRKAYYISKFENGSFNKDITELEKLNKRVTGFNTFEDEGDELDRTFSGYKMSKNREFLLLFKSTKEGYVNAVYNSDFTLFYYKVIPNEELKPTSSVVLTDMQVDNNGNIIYIYRKNINKILTDFWVTIISKNIDLKKINIEVKDKRVIDLTIVNNPSNEFIAAGIYSTEEIPYEFGSFTKNLTLNTPIVLSKFTATTLDEMKRFAGGMYGYKINYSFSLNENIYMIMEQKYSVKSTVKGKDGTPKEITIMHNNEMFILKFDNYGKLIETKLIEKNYEGDDGAVKIFKDGSELHFVYNNDISRVKLGREFKSGKTFVTTFDVLKNTLETKQALDVEGVLDKIKSKYVYYLGEHKFMLKREEGLKSYYFTVFNF